MCSFFIQEFVEFSEWRDLMENYFFETFDEVDKDSRVYVLIIYDIIDNKRRSRLVKYLSGYGFRVQKSCFEAKISDKIYAKMLSGLDAYATNEDSIRVYKIIGKGQVTIFGKENQIDDEEVVII